MNFTTMIFGAFVFFFVWRGYHKGFIGSITRIISWLIAYPAAIYLTKPLADLIFKHTPLTGMIVYFIAGSIIFLIVSASVSKLLSIFSEKIPEDAATEQSSRIGGAIVGIFIGGIVGLLAVYAIDLTHKPTTVNLQNNEELLYESENNISSSNQKNISTSVNSDVDSFIDKSAKKLVSTVAATAVDLALKDPATTSLTKAFAENPQSMLGHVQQLSNDGHLKTLLADPDIQQLLTSGDTNALLSNKDFQTLMRNEDMRAILASVKDDKTGASSEQLAAEKMTVAWERANALKNDPQVIAILTDPEFQEQINASNKLPLLTNPKLKILTELIFASEQAVKAAPTEMKKIDSSENILEPSLLANEEKTSGNPEKKTLEKTEKKPDAKIYQWTDENGKVHYSDSPTKI
ncbi:MAG: CvpA family protein [Pseudomonadota bacterium]